MLWPILLILILLIGIWLQWRYRHRHLLQLAEKIPGPPTVPLLGNAISFMCQPEDDVDKFKIRHCYDILQYRTTWFRFTNYTISPYHVRFLLAPIVKQVFPKTFSSLTAVKADVLFLHYIEMIKVLKNLIENYGSVLRFWLGADLNIVVSNPDDIRLLLTNSKMNVKGPQYKYMADFIGGGILSGSGSVWRKHRKMANANYGKRAIESYNAIFYQEVNLLLEVLRGLPKNEVIDIYYHIVKTTSYTVCQTLMGLSREETLNIPYLQKLIDVSPRLYDIIFDRMTKWYLQIDPIFWLTEAYTLQKNMLQSVHQMSTFIINERIKRLDKIEDTELELLNSDQDSIKNTKLSVVDRFILSNELDSKELIEETFTIFTSSQEASAKIASFLLLMMAYHPKCQEKLYAEIATVIGNRSGPISDDDLKQMPYLEKAFKEVLRLFPIGVMLQRTVREDIEISTCTLPAGSSLVIPIFHIHRDPRFWDNPEAFDPERFSTENIKRRNPYCYIPFSLGAMDCLGRYFGTKLVKTIAIKILQEFKVISLNEYKDLRVVMAISAKSLNGYPMTLKPR